MKITIEQLQKIASDINEDNIYNFRYFKKSLDEILGEEYLNLYIPLFGYIFSELKIYSDFELKNTTMDNLEKIMEFINTFEDKRNPNFVYASHM